VSLEFRVSCSENLEKSLEKVVGGWVDSEGHRGVKRYSVNHVSSVEWGQKWGQDTGLSLSKVKVVNSMSKNSQGQELLP